MSFILPRPTISPKAWYSCGFLILFTVMVPSETVESPEGRHEGAAVKIRVPTLGSVRRPVASALAPGAVGDVYFFMLSGVLGVLSGLSNPFGHCDLTGPGVPFAWCAHCASCASSDERGGDPPHVCVGVAWPGILLIWEAASLSRTAEPHPIGSNPTLESLCCGCLRAPEPLEYGFGPKIMNCKKSGKSMKITGIL